MKLTSKSGRKSIQSLIVEPLESRIAPATINIGNNSTDTHKQNTEYHEQGDPRLPEFSLLNFTDTSNSADPISLALDDAPLGSLNHGALGTSENTYFLQLSPGDIVNRFGSGNQYKSFITVTSGHVVVYFTDHNNDNEFNEGELTGLSLSSGAVLEVKGTVYGDIATNLNDHKTKSLADDTVDTTGLVSVKQGIKSLTLHDATGSIFSASDISKISTANDVANIYAGSAVNGKGFDFFGGSLGGKGTFTFPLAAGQKGASISNITVGSVGGVIQAGDGGAGAKGGSLTGIKINQDTDGFALLAGKGGDGDSATKKQSGGVGGSVSGVYIFGEEDGTANSANGIVIRAGDGGAGLTTTKGAAGGKVSKVYVGYELTPTGRVESANLSADAVFIAGGAGGTGKTGGAGGSVTDSKVRTRAPEINGVEISIYAGDGGTSLSPTGRAGAGGSLSLLDLRNQSLGSGTDILVQAGRGGSTTGNGIGAVGGSITDLQLLSFDEQVIAGNGSDGKKGGAGGSIARISFNSDSSVLPNNLLIDAGRGGAGTGGAGGNAGNITSINVPATDLDTFLINSGTKGNGGDSTSNGTTLGSKGGRGSSLSKINIADDDSDAQLEAVGFVRAGLGGSGSKGGGAGGVISAFNFSATDVTFAVSAGAGGDALDKGKGGAGGTIVNSLFVSSGTVASLPVSGVVQTGNGGAGRGTKGAGGAGGFLKAIQLSTPGDATVQAGNGGSGETTLGFIVGGAAGAGGSITAVGILSNASGVLRAGDAGLDGLKAGNGGSIKGETSLLNGVPLTINGVHADINISIIAGKGSHGGYGGDISGISYSSTQEDLTPSPSGSILVQAGDGSAEGKVGGKGGSILHMDSGSVSSGAFQTTRFIAGNGGGGAEVVRAGAGGSITGVTIARGGALGGEFTIKAGDAGNSDKGAKGAAGGSVKTFDVTDIDPATILRSIASGDGGKAIKKGGLGGSVTGVHVQEHDIGVRTGQTFGYSTMGGIFAGVGGIASDAKGKAGLNGSVIGIGADAISSIVAGRTGTPVLAEKVAQINLNKDFTSLLYNLNGVFPSNGAFKLAFNGEEHLFPAGASAKEVENALNLFNGISNLHGVKVTSTRFGGYEIKFNDVGNQSAIGGIEQIPVKVSEAIPGSIKPFTITEIKPGIVNLPIVETRPGQGAFITLEATPGERFLATSEQTSGDPDNNVNEVQLLDISYLATHPTGAFTLTFEGETTGQLLPTATTSDIQTALNTLQTITSQNGVLVTTSNSGAGRFLIAFGNDSGQNPITGSFLVSEVQHLDLSNLVAIQGSTFSLTYEGQSIAQIPTTSTKAQIESALNLLSTIITDGKVVVTDTAPSEFDIKFIVNGDRNAILVTDQVKEVQTLALGSFSNEVSGDLYLYFGTQVTPALSPTSTAAQIDAALEALSGIGIGGVVVTEDSLHTFSVTFQTNGQKQELVAQGKVFEKQLLDLTAYSTSITSEYTLKTSSYADVVEQVIGSSLSLPTATTRQGAIHEILAITTRAGVDPNLPASTGSAESQYLELGSLYTDPFAEFYLDYQGARTTFLKASASATQVQNALNKLGADVSVVSNTPGTYDVTFNQNQNQQQIIGKVGIREIQTLSTNPLTGVPGAEFSLQAGVNITNPISNTAASNRVQEALDSLPSLVPFGGVTVTSTGVNAYTFTAKDLGDMPNIIGKGAGTAGHESQILQLTSFASIPNTYFELTFNGATSGPLPSSATAAQIQAALNGLTSVAGLRPDNNGAVVASVLDIAKPNDFRVDFNVFDNQPAISVRLYTDDISGPNIIVETTPGKQVSLPTTVAQQGSVQNITATTPTVGTAGTVEIQHITLGALASNAQAEFYLTPDGVSKTAFLAGTASAADIQTALGLIGVSATVTRTGVGSFDITYTTNGDASQLTGKIGFRESVNLDTAAISAFIGAEYTVKAGTSITAPLSNTTTDAQLDAVLDTLTSLLPTGAVTVTSTGVSTFNIKANDLGDMPDIVANGGKSSDFEVQTLKLSSYTATPNTTFTLAFDGQTIAPALPVTATTAQVQAALNALTSIKNIRADGTGAVTVTAPDALNLNDYQITFNVFGDQSSLTSKLISDYLFARQLDTELVHGSTKDLISTNTLQGVVDDVLVETLRDGVGGNPGIREIQTVTFASGSLSGNPLAEFYLNVNANRTAFLPVAADAATVQAAISAILTAPTTPPTVPPALGVTVTGAPGAYTITFSDFKNIPQLSGKIGIRETQTLDTSALNGIAGAEYVLTAGGDTTAPFDATATIAVQIAAISSLVNTPATTLPQVSALSGASLLPIFPATTPVGAIVVSSSAPNIINIKAGDFGDMPDILARGGGKINHQVHDLDLTNFFSAPGVSFVVSVNGDTSIALPVGTTNPTLIENAINALANVQTLRTGNTGKVIVTVPDVAKPHDFRIEYNIFGDQSATIGVLTGVDTVNPLLSNGLTSRLGYNSTPAQVEAALKAVNLVDVTVTAGASQGLFEVVYKNKGDQPLIVGSVFTHEVQRVDPYGVGNFHITFNAESTPDFPINVSAATIEAAIEALPSFKQLTNGGVTVTTNADSSYSIVFDGDKDMSSFSGQQFENFRLNVQDGTLGRVEIQTLTPIFKGEFLTSKYNVAGLVGAIVDTNEIDSNIFTFIHNNTLLKANPTNHVVFVLGDMPVDGILMAKIFDQTTCNFTPEASLTAGGFFDNDNIIS